MPLEGKIVLVTGAASGIGKAISLKLAGERAKVALLDKSQKGLEKVKKTIEEKGGNACDVLADLRDTDQVKEAVGKVVEYYHGLDVLVNNAGLGIFKGTEKLSVEDWDTQINVMLRGTFLVTKYALPIMYKKKSGHIINISSLWAKQGSRLSSAYTAAKYGIRGFTDSLRIEARGYNVKITNIMPATVNTPFFDKCRWKHDFSKALQPEEVADFISDILKYPGNMVVEEAVLRAVGQGDTD